MIHNSFITRITESENLCQGKVFTTHYTEYTLKFNSTYTPKLHFSDLQSLCHCDLTPFNLRHLMIFETVSPTALARNI